jgi:apolipoprotein N-acyltransferase
VLTSRRPGFAALATLSTRLPFPAAAAVAVAGGLCLWLAFPDLNIWPLAPVGVALFALAVRGQRAPVGAVLGLLAGLAYFSTLLHWSGV